MIFFGGKGGEEKEEEKLGRVGGHNDYKPLSYKKHLCELFENKISYKNIYKNVIHIVFYNCCQKFKVNIFLRLQET